MIRSVLSWVFGLFRKPLVLGSPAANALVIAQIAQQGDDGSEERHVRHVAYPGRDQPGGLSFAVDILTEAGLDASEAQYRRGVLGEHYAAVATPEFDQLTEQLRDDFAQLGWEYDGWECAVLKS